MFSRLFGKSKAASEEINDDEAISIHWSQLWPELGLVRTLSIHSSTVVEPLAGSPLKDNADVSRHGMFGKWSQDIKFQPETVGDVGIRLHALPRKYDHTGNPDLTNCIGLIVLKNPRSSRLMVMLWDYEFGYGVHKDSPENLHGEPVVQKYREKSRSFYFADFSGVTGTLSLSNMNWMRPSVEMISLGI